MPSNRTPVLHTEENKPFSLILINGTTIDVVGTQKQIDKVRGLIQAKSENDWVNLPINGCPDKRLTCLPTQITAIVYTK